MTREEAIMKWVIPACKRAWNEKKCNEIFEALEQEPKTGHWIDNTDLGYHVSICSNCEWRGHGDVNLIYRPKYCPNCGAKMEVEE